MSTRAENQNLECVNCRSTPTVKEWHEHNRGNAGLGVTE